MYVSIAGFGHGNVRVDGKGNAVVVIPPCNVTWTSKWLPENASRDRVRWVGEMTVRVEAPTAAITNEPGAHFRIAGGYPTALPDVTRMSRTRWPFIPRYSHSAYYLWRKAGLMIPEVSVALCFVSEQCKVRLVPSLLIMSLYFCCAAQVPGISEDIVTAAREWAAQGEPERRDCTASIEGKAWLHPGLSARMVGAAYLRDNLGSVSRYERPE